MANIGMGGEIPQNIQQTNKIKESQRTERKDGVRDREQLAGAKQVEAKHSKEEVSKTEGRFKAYKKAYEYLLGDEPQDQIDEDWGESAKVEEEIIVQQLPKRPELDEIEQYNTRERFKSKLKYFLGDDFNEEEEYQEENLISNEKSEDNHLKLSFAKRAYETLFQYIYESLGDFDFDRIEDNQLLLDYGMPENAVYKFLFLHQLARSSADFPNVMDVSILMYKLKKLGLEITSERLVDIINDDFETLKKVKYTIAGFVYVPLQEILVKIEEDLSSFYKNQFYLISENLNLPYLDSFSLNLPKEYLIKLKERFNISIYEIEEAKKQIKTLELKIKLNLQKNSLPIKEEITRLSEKIEIITKEITGFEFDLMKYIYIYSFLNSNLKISEYNKNIPIQAIKKTIDIITGDSDKDEINNFINDNISLTKLKPVYPEYKDEIRKSSEIFDLKVKSAISEINKINNQKQSLFFKNAKNSSFEVCSNIYFYSQRKLNT